MAPIKPGRTIQSCARPGKKKPDRAAEGTREIHIIAPFLWIRRSQFGVTEPPDQQQHSAEEP